MLAFLHGLVSIGNGAVLFMMKIVEIEYGSDLYREALILRDEMLRKPIGLKHSEADLVAEQTYRHFGILLEDRLVACLMLVPHGPEVAQVRQMAVLDELQGSGYGRFIMTGVEAILRDEGQIVRIFLNARGTAIGFYEKLGYNGVGDTFTEVGIPHLRMEKPLKDEAPFSGG